MLNVDTFPIPPVIDSCHRSDVAQTTSPCPGLPDGATAASATFLPSIVLTCCLDSYTALFTPRHTGQSPDTAVDIL